MLVKIYYADDCESQYSNCEDYTPEGQGEGDELKKCVFFDGQCRLKKCSELSRDYCEYFGADERGFKCTEKISIDNNSREVISHGCALQQCSDYPVGYCHWFPENEDNGVICGENKEYTKCVVKTCSDFKPGRCKEAYFSNIGIQCAESEDGKSCITKKCSDFNSNECDNYIAQNNDWERCVPEGDKCKMKDCNSLTPPNCGVINPIPREEYTCIENSGMCEQVIKRCEDLPYDYCGLYPSSIFYREEKKKLC